MQTLHFQKKIISLVKHKEDQIPFSFQILCKNQSRKLTFYHHSVVTAPLMTTLFMCYKKSPDIYLGKHFWNFNSSLIQDDKNLSEMKEYVNFIKFFLDTIFSKNPHCRWQFSKYETCKLTIRYSKTKVRKRHKKIETLEKNLITLDQHLKITKIY